MAVSLLSLAGPIHAYHVGPQGGGGASGAQEGGTARPAPRAEALGHSFRELVERHEIVTAGIGLIRNGELVWTGYFGEQSPGIPASRETRFDVASITKTVTAETILRLVGAGELSLDEPMAPHWVDPDLADDPRHRLLTPRMALNHSTGLPNWRFFRTDGKLTFIGEPGSAYGYSGEGFEYLARYAERKLGRAFDSLVRSRLFEPLGIYGASFSVRAEDFGELARPVDEAGVFHGYYCRPRTGSCRREGEYSAADDLRITVEDYATFLISAMNGEGYGSELADDRNRVQTERGAQAVVDCEAVPADQCPLRQGYGLGWEILDYGDTRLIGHGGSDWSEVTRAYFYTGSRDGVIIFLNAPNARALAAMPEAIELLDPGSPMATHYRMRIERQRARAARERQE